MYVYIYIYMIFPRSPKPESIILIEPGEEKTLSSHSVTLSGFGESTMSIYTCVIFRMESNIISIKFTTRKNTYAFRHKNVIRVLTVFRLYNIKYYLFFDIIFIYVWYLHTKRNYVK